jgi:5'-nucleotidase
MLTNDDGIDARGLAALEEAVAGLGEIWVVAPATGQSAMSHALTLHKPMRVNEHGERRFSVTGTPTDTVFLGVLHLLPRRPDLVLSGINHGANIGFDTSYSGTVAAALEAAIMGLKGVAFSHGDWKEPDFGPGLPWIRDIASAALANDFPSRTYLNVNVPDVPEGDIQGVRMTRLGRREWDDCIVPCTDPRGRPYYWIGGSGYTFDEIPGTDTTALADGFVSVTPLKADPTAEEAIPAFRAWGIER